MALWDGNILCMYNSFYVILDCQVTVIIPGGKNFLVYSSFSLGRLSSFLTFWGDGGEKEVNEGQPLPCCFYLHLLLDTLCQKL